jgi:hypothetical protein
MYFHLCGCLSSPQNPESVVRAHMPYIISFIKSLVLTDQNQYINDCCIGGDLILEQLLPAIAERYGDLMSNQEDWGWFVWFEDSGVRLAVDVHTNDHYSSEFQIHLTSSIPRFLFGLKIQDTPELESLKELVTSALRAWGVAKLEVRRVNEKHMPN